MRLNKFWKECDIIVLFCPKTFFLVLAYKKVCSFLSFIFLKHYFNFRHILLRRCSFSIKKVSCRCSYSHVWASRELRTCLDQWTVLLFNTDPYVILFAFIHLYKNNCKYEDFCCKIKTTEIVFAIQLSGIVLLPSFFLSNMLLLQMILITDNLRIRMLDDVDGYKLLMTCTTQPIWFSCLF